MRRSRWLAVGVAAMTVAAGCSHSGRSSSSVTTRPPAATKTPANAAAAATNPCQGPLRATDVGVTPTDITIEVMADVGSPLAPGIFKGAFEALQAFAARINAQGGLACRQLKVRTWDSKLDAAEAKNGQIDACSNAFAMVGTTSGFNNDVSTLNSCGDATGGVTGLPDITGFSSEDGQCGPTIFKVIPQTQGCPIPPGDNTYSEPVGYTRWQLQQDPGLHGIYLLDSYSVPLTLAGVALSAGMQQAGVVWDAVPKVSLLNTQTDYTARVEVARAKGSTYVFNGSNDTAMVFMRKEAAAQGENSVKVWGCPSGCYTKAFLADGGTNVEGTYLWLDFLPFEEASHNADEEAFINGVGPANADTYGAYAWQAADAFEDAVNAVVAKDGPNGLTRANLLAALRGLGPFDAHGWLGSHALTGQPADTPCFVVLQVQHGKFVRVYPTAPGTMDCNPANLATVTVDAAAVAATLK